MVWYSLVWYGIGVFVTVNFSQYQAARPYFGVRYISLIVQYTTPTEITNRNTDPGWGSLLEGGACCTNFDMTVSINLPFFIP